VRIVVENNAGVGCLFWLLMMTAEFRLNHKSWPIFSRGFDCDLVAVGRFQNAEVKSDFSIETDPRIRAVVRPNVVTCQSDRSFK
jgi:hypothetical protein